MEVTGMEDTPTGISRILLWEEVREPYSDSTLAILEAQKPMMTSFELHVSQFIQFFHQLDLNFLFRF